MIQDDDGHSSDGSEYLTDDDSVGAPPQLTLDPGATTDTLAGTQQLIFSQAYVDDILGQWQPMNAVLPVSHFMPNETMALPHVVGRSQEDSSEDSDEPPSLVARVPEASSSSSDDEWTPRLVPRPVEDSSDDEEDSVPPLVPGPIEDSSDDEDDSVPSLVSRPIEDSCDKEDEPQQCHLFCEKEATVLEQAHTATSKPSLQSSEISTVVPKKGSRCRTSKHKQAIARKAPRAHRQAERKSRHGATITPLASSTCEM